MAVDPANQRRPVRYLDRLKRLEYQEPDGSWTQIVLSSGGGGGGSGAPVGAEYVVLAFNGTLTNESVLSVAGDGLALNPGTGSIAIESYFTTTQRLLGRNTATAGLGEELTISLALDWVTDTHGAILFRDSLDWNRLLPGLSGYVLTTQGAGANPVWAPPAGGAPSGSAGGDLGGSYPNPVVDVARGLRESGGTEYPMGAVASGEVLRELSGSIVGISTQDLVASGYPVPPRPTHSPQYWCWAAATSLALGTSALATNSIHYVLDLEEQEASTYDAMILRHETGAASGFAKLALYSVGTDGNPDELLWYSADLDISAAATFTATFAGGTWTTAGNAWKDGSDRLVRTRGQGVYTAWMKNVSGAASTVRVLGLGSARALGTNSGITNMYVGFTATRTFASGFPDPAASLTSHANVIPAISLRWI